MHLIQILLPLCGRDGSPLARDLFVEVAKELTERFGGVTAYARAPARGFWEGPAGQAERDDIVVHEVMTETVDEPWWAGYRATLEKRFLQDEVVIRSLEMRRL